MLGMKQELSRLGYGGSSLARFTSLGEYMEDNADGFDIRDSPSYIPPENPNLSEDTSQVRTATRGQLNADFQSPEHLKEVSFMANAPLSTYMVGPWGEMEDSDGTYDPISKQWTFKDPSRDDHCRWEHEADNFAAQERANRVKEWTVGGKLFDKNGERILGQDECIYLMRGKMGREETAEKILRWIGSAPVRTVRRSQNRFWQRIRCSRAECYPLPPTPSCARPRRVKDISQVWLTKPQVDAIMAAFKRRLKPGA